jgi:trimeric autotransporter adhesin
MYVLLLILHLFTCVYSQEMYNYTSGITLPLNCPSDTYPVTQTGAFIDIPIGADGVQIRQIVFGHRAAAPPMLTNVSIIGNGVTGEVNFPTSSLTCCSANGCDLASYAIYSSGSWFDTPMCGKQSLCGPPVQWYSLSFENTPAGICPGCGIYGAGTIDMTIDFQGNMVAIPDYGTGGTMYVSYYPVFPVSPTSTPSETASPSMSITVSESVSVSPSETSTNSEMASISVSMSQSLTETPSPVSPSLSPSTSVSVSLSKSVTASQSPSRSPVGICNHAYVMMWGITEGVQGDVFYTIRHGINITHPYLPNNDMSVGKNPSCTETATTCTCSYLNGAIGEGCASARYSTITYTYGPQTITTFIQQNPQCVYYFGTTLNVISPTPSSSISPSMSASRSGAPSPTVSRTMSSSMSVAETPSSTLSPSPSMSPSITQSSSDTASTSVTPTSVGCAFRTILDGGYNYTAEQNADYDPGQDISYHLLSGDCSTTITQCAQYCSSQVNCVGIIMDTSYVSCWTKPSLNSKVFAADRVAWHRMLIPSITPSSSISPSVTQTLTQSSSSTPSVSISRSGAPSPTVSKTMSSTETPSPVSPSVSPSTSASVSVSKSVTASRSSSRSPVGVCNHAQAMLYGTYEWVIGPTGSLYYYILHGTNVSHIFSPSYMLMGKNPTCTETTTTCTCVYTQGDSAVCGYSRQSTITYSYGTETKTTFTLQNPDCIYYFSTTLNIVSPTPSSSISPSTSPSVTPSASPIGGLIELIADSTADFQPIQGNNGWYYNYYNESMMINQFPDFGPNPLGVSNNWIISGSYCRINMNAIHGNSPYDCNTPSYGWCYPSLYWVNANYSYEHFIVNIKASHTLYTPPGVDGVKLNVSINNNQIDSYQTPFTVNKNYTAVNITDVELVLDPIQGCFSDKTDQNVKIYAYKPVMFSPTPSSSPSVSITKSRTPSKSASPSFSSSQTNSLTATLSITGSITSTPLFFVTAWPSLSSTSTRTPTSTPLFMITPWPTRGFTSTRTSTPKMYIVYYPSASSSQLPMGIQAELEESDTKDSTAKIVGGVAVGAGALALGGVIFTMVQSARAPSPEDTTKAPDDNTDDNSDENSKRISQDDNSEDSTKRASLEGITENTIEDTSEENTKHLTHIDDFNYTTQRRNILEDDEQITPRPSIRQHIEYIDSHNSSPVTVKITSIMDTGILLRDNTRSNKDSSGNNTKEEPDYEPLISYFYYKKLQEHIHESAENNTEIN